MTKDETNKHNLINLLIDKEGNQYFDDQQMADLINNFYVNQPRDLLDSISSMSPGVHPCTTDSACSTSKINPLVIPQISESEIENAIRLMPMHKAAGADSLSAKILKISACAISSPLARIINYCIDNSCFPSAWKLAEVIPIYKGKGSKSDMNNYRPILLLPLLSKIFERHIHTAMYNHLNGNNLLYNLQSGFCKTYSTETALIRLIDQLFWNLDNDEINGLVFIDYKKAFDLIDHKILLSKLEHFGIAPKELSLFENYLKDRCQFGHLIGKDSTYKTIEYGVPQGSMLGPLLFLMTINDLPRVVTKSLVDIYADDTTLSASASITNPSKPSSKRPEPSYNLVS